MKHVKEDSQDLWHMKGISAWLLSLPLVGLHTDPVVSVRLSDHLHRALCLPVSPAPAPLIP